MATWTIAAVQMDVRLGDREGNLERIRSHLAEAARKGARLVVFPECALTGYCFDGKDEAWPHAETIPGPTTSDLTEDCHRLGVHVVLGMLEARPLDRALFNVAVLIGPGGVVASYRKTHLPFLGVDRYTTPGDLPYAVHDIGGLRVGINICYDGSFPEAARCLMLQGADLIVLPTNFPPGAQSTVRYLLPARALENNLYYLVANRIGEERGFRFIGQSRIFDVTGDTLGSVEEQAGIVYAEIDPRRARNKQIIRIPGKYELHRTAHRRPDLYGPILRPVDRSEADA